MSNKSKWITVLGYLVIVSLAIAASMAALSR